MIIEPFHLEIQFTMDDRYHRRTIRIVCESSNFTIGISGVHHTRTSWRTNMATQTASPTKMFEDVFENFKKVAETTFETQQELLNKWTAGWPQFPQPETAWLERVQKFQKAWAKTVKELLTKHGEVLDEQYRLALGSLEEAFRVSQASDPQEYVKRCEALCRKSLDVMHEAAKLQSKELLAALNKLTELVGKSAE
jgi:hypothetical protein